MEFSDGLCHWKYIKKVRKNGKWRYYYDIKDALGYNKRKDAANAMYRYEYVAKNLEGEYPNQEAMEAKSNRAALLGQIGGKYIDEYNKTPLAKVEKMKDVMNSGRRAVSKFLSKVASKIAPSNEPSFTNKYRTVGHEKVYTWDTSSGKWKRTNK